jgi:hypothetical protein
MDMSSILPRGTHPHLRWLGKLDPWYSTGKGDGLRTDFYVDSEKIANAPGFPEHEAFLKVVLGESLDGRRATYSSALAMCYLDAVAMGLAHGPKIFCPTEEQFDSCQHIDLHIPMSMYRQPYPCMFVKIPSGSRKSLAMELGMNSANTPELVIVRHREQGPTLFLGQRFLLDQEENTHFIQDREEFEDLEAAIRVKHPKEGEDMATYHWSERTGRSVLNLMLLLTHYGWERGQPLHPKEYEQHRSGKRPELAHLCQGDFVTINMKQNVVVRRTPPPRERGESMGLEQGPQWRSGHWRREAGYRDVLAAGGTPKIIFIRPYRTKWEQTVGDIGDSTVTMRLK